MNQPPPPFTPQSSPVSDVNAQQAAAQAAADLRESEEKYRAFFENSIDAILLTSPDGSIQEANPAACAMLGRTEAEICALGRDGLVDANDPRLHALLAERARTGRTYGELTMFRRDGTPFPVEMSSALFQDSHGRARTSMIIRDITERKRAEETLRLSEERFSHAFRVGPAARTITRIADGTFVDANESFLKMFEFSREEVIGHTSTELKMWTPEERHKLIQKQLEAGGLQNFELQARAKSGRIVQILFSSRPFELAGEPHHITTMIDITERKRAEEALREINNRLANIVATTPGIVCSFRLRPDGSACFPFGGERVAEAYGIPQGRLAEDAAPFFALVYPDDLEGLRESIADSARRLSTWRHEWRVRHPVRGEVWIEGHSVPLREPDSSTVWHGVATDITDHKHAEEALHDSEERLRLSTELANVAVWEYDFIQNCMARSKNHDRLYGLEWQTVWDINTFLNATHPDDREFSNAMIQKSVAAGGPDQYVFDFRVIHPDQSLHWLSVTGQVIKRDPEGQGTLVRGCLFDITDRKRAEEEIRTLNAELEQRIADRTAELAARNKELETFTYSVSHDLKAPLRGIDGYSQLLLDEYAAKLDDEGRHFLHTIRDATRQMTQLIDDLLAYSRLERRPVTIGLVNPHALVENLMTFYAAQIAERRATVHTDVGCTAVTAEAEGLMQALRNLLDNALKFTRDAPAPVIEIGSRETAQSCIMWVRDNGIGFDMKYHDRIFDIFQRLQRAEEYPGTGVGLAIVRKAVERMGGRVWAESTLGHGATFYLEIPK